MGEKIDNIREVSTVPTPRDMYRGNLVVLLQKDKKVLSLETS